MFTKLLIAVGLDAVDYFVATIPIVNSVWDLITTGVLYLMLNHKPLATGGLTELVFPALPLFAQVDMFMPTATILTIIDEVYYAR